MYVMHPEGPSTSAHPNVGCGIAWSRLFSALASSHMSQAMLRPLPERAPAPALHGAPIAVSGKFFFVGDHKVYVRGVSYGPFGTSRHGFPFPSEDVLETDFRLMAELGANTLRTFTLPPRWLLDRAAEHGLRLLVGIPWAEHVCFLDSDELTTGIRRTIADAVDACRDHPAVGAYLVGNEIPPDIVRWYGARRIAGFLRELKDLVKSIDPGSLVGYANFPSTEYLETDFTDFVAFNVYLHRETDLRRYLYRLHTLAGERPLVLTEFGMDSMRHGVTEQADTLS